MSLFVPTWHTEKRGQIASPSNPDNPEKPFPPLSGEESQSIYPRLSVPALPGRVERPCLACGRECRDGELFHDETCFESWKARRRRSTSPQAARAATCPAPSIPLETTGPRGTA